jgi:hypothetical protein
MPDVRCAIRQGIALFTTVFPIAIGISLIVTPQPLFWLSAALGVMMCSVGFQFSLSTHLTDLRRRIGLPVLRVLQLWCVANALAGCLFFIGAMSSFAPIPAAMAAFAACCWVSLWGWILKNELRSSADAGL